MGGITGEEPANSLEYGALDRCRYLCLMSGQAAGRAKQREVTAGGEYEQNATASRQSEAPVAKHQSLRTGEGPELS